MFTYPSPVDEMHTFLDLEKAAQVESEADDDLQKDIQSVGPPLL